MEYDIKAKDCAFPCEVTIDPDNGRYMIRKSDTSGEVFQNVNDLKEWISQNWNVNEFEDPSQFTQLLNELESMPESYS
jgi:hypothetical protein